MRHLVSGVLGAALLITSGIASAAFVRQSAADCQPENSFVVWVNNRGWVNTDWDRPRFVLCQVPDDDRLSPQNIRTINVHGHLFGSEQYVAELFTQSFNSDNATVISRRIQTTVGEITLKLPFSRPPFANFSYVKISLPRFGTNASFRGLFYAN